MIHLTAGNMFEVDVEAIVNTVNLVGVMGKGVALECKKRFPEIMEPYQEACRNETLRIGQVQVIPLVRPRGPKYIINFPTKVHWRRWSQVGYIESGLQSLATEIIKYNISSVAIPPLGCGNGGLHWSQVSPLIQRFSECVPETKLLVFEPD